MKSLILPLALISLPLMAATSEVKIASDKVTVTTTANQKLPLNQGALWSKLESVLRKNPSFSGLQIRSSKSSSTTDNEDKTTVSTDHFVFFKIKHSPLPAALFQFTINDSGCKDSFCTEQSALIQGPVATYGSVDPMDDPEKLLRDKQTFSWTVKTTEKQTLVIGEFAIKSLTFEASISKLVRDYFKNQVDPTLLDVQRLAAHFVKSINEEIL